jgi:hypothetical protein
MAARASPAPKSKEGQPSAADLMGGLEGNIRKALSGTPLRTSLIDNTQTPRTLDDQRACARA